MDKTNSLYEHIRNRLPMGYGYGNDEKEFNKKGIPNHQTSFQSLREDCEGDVGIFELLIEEQKKYSGYTCFKSQVQIAVVTKNGDITGAEDYLLEALGNIKSNEMSTQVWVKQCSMVNLRPLGKNDQGLHMVAMTIALKYLLNDGADEEDSEEETEENSGVGNVDKEE